jgi:hypothetical protein
LAPSCVWLSNPNRSRRPAHHGSARTTRPWHDSGRQLTILSKP